MACLYSGGVTNSLRHLLAQHRLRSMPPLKHIRMQIRLHGYMRRWVGLLIIIGLCVSNPNPNYVDNVAGVSFQQSTCASSKLGGIFDSKRDWIKERKYASQFTAVKVATDKNVADLLTKCLT